MWYSRSFSKLLVKSQVNFPQKSSSKFQKPGSTGKMNIASAVKEPALQADFFDEKGLLKEYQPKSMHVLSGTSSDKPIMIEFHCGLTPLSFDRKLTLPGRYRSRCQCYQQEDLQ